MTPTEDSPEETPSSAAAAAAAAAATTTTTSTQDSMEKLRALNWNGSIPVSLSLAPSSLFSPTIPPPVHVLVSRNTFLHVGLKQAVLRLHKFAPPTFSFTRRKVIEEPERCSRDDDDGDGSNNDVKNTKDSDTKTKDRSNNEDGDGNRNVDKQKSADESYPVCWFEDEASELPLRWQLFAGILYDSHYGSKQQQSQSKEKNQLPWKIRVHFTQYPSSQLLPLETGIVLTVIEKNFKHSLKQALVLQHGSNKVALNMTKQSHQQLWSSIVSSKYSIYKLIHDDIQATGDQAVDSIPVRLLLGPSKPWIQKRCNFKGDGTNGDASLTLGSLLLQWAPQYFALENETSIQPKSASISWRICGVAPPLSTRLIDLWRTMCHPDSFLYITVVY